MVSARRPGRLAVVAGTGTDVGKTWVGAAVARCLVRQGRSVAVRKPAQSAAPGSITDACVLAQASGETPDAVAWRDGTFDVALAPPMAAEVTGRRAPLIDELADWTAASWPAEPRDAGLVELVGGVLSPHAPDGDGIDLTRRIGPDLVVLVAHAGLGTINDVRLSVAALRAVAAPVVVMLNRFDPSDDLHCRNREWLAGRCQLEVEVLVDGLAWRIC